MQGVERMDGDTRGQAMEDLVIEVLLKDLKH